MRTHSSQKKNWAAGVNKVSVTSVILVSGCNKPRGHMSKMFVCLNIKVCRGKYEAGLVKMERTEKLAQYHRSHRLDQILMTDVILQMC